MKREVLEVEGVEHVAPTPMGVKLGNMIFSSAIMGKDPATGEIPDDVDKELEFVFKNMETLLKKGGGSTDNIGHINYFVSTKEIRPKINEHWLSMFPDENNRPVRHVLKIEMPKGVNLQARFIAVL